MVTGSDFMMLHASHAHRGNQQATSKIVVTSTGINQGVSQVVNVNSRGLAAEPAGSMVG